MRCCELERYLEACIDGHLDEAHLQALKRHLASCSSCHARVSALQAFERDLRMRFRSMEHASSLWSPLELDMVGGREQRRSITLRNPPLPPSQSRSARPRRAMPIRRSPLSGESRSEPPRAANRKDRVVGAALVLAAFASVFQLTLSWLRDGPSGGAAEVYRAYLEDAVEPALVSSNPGVVREWASAEMIRDLPPPPVPAAVDLKGAAIIKGMGDPTALYAYDSLHGEVVLLLEPEASEPAPIGETVTTASEDGLTTVSWNDTAFAYTVVGEAPRHLLAEFIP